MEYVAFIDSDPSRRSIKQMANSAYELAGVLTTWAQPPNQAPEAARGSSPNSLAFWHSQVHALELVRKVEHFVEELAVAGQRNPAHDAVVLRCYHAVGGWDPKWQAAVGDNTEKPLLDEMHLGMLRTLGALMDARAYSADPEPAAIEQVKARLEEIRPLIEGLADLPGELQAYLAVLLGEAEEAVEEYASLGYLPLRSKAIELGGLIVSISLSNAVKDPETRRQLARVGLTLLANVGGNLAATGLIELGAEAIKAIGG